MDTKIRCFGQGSALYSAYHDEEWGRPVYKDPLLLEMLLLEGAQAGLSWETVLKKREEYRRVFHRFDPLKVASLTDEELEEALKNPGIIRNRLKVYAFRKNAQVFLHIQKEFGSFSTYLWDFVGGKPVVHAWNTKEEIPTKNKESIALSQSLQRYGMTFVGPTIMYSYMQAVGLINDHLASCFLYNL